MGRYAVIGTREPSEQAYKKAVSIASFLVKNGHEVTTGGADGIDAAAMEGAAAVDVSKLHIFLPWDGYNDGKLPEGANYYLYAPDTCPNWLASVKKYHPSASNLTRGPMALHARNFGIVMYPDPVDAVIAYPGGDNPDKWGGTGQGMRIAIGEGVPLFNIRIKDEYHRLRAIFNQM